MMNKKTKRLAANGLVIVLWAVLVLHVSFSNLGKRVPAHTLGWGDAFYVLLFLLGMSVLGWLAVDGIAVIIRELRDTDDR